MTGVGETLDARVADIAAAATPARLRASGDTTSTRPWSKRWSDPGWPGWWRQPRWAARRPILAASSRWWRRYLVPTARPAGARSNYLAGILPEQAAREVFRDVSRPGAGPFAPGGRAQASGDGYLISGRWTYASGCRHAAIAASGVMVFDGEEPAERNPDGSPVLRLAVLTEDQFTVVETWDTVGMRGTGSDDITATDVLARDRVGTLWDPMWPDDPIFRLRAFDMGLSGRPVGSEP